MYQDRVLCYPRMVQNGTCCPATAACTAHPTASGGAGIGADFWRYLTESRWQGGQGVLRGCTSAASTAWPDPASIVSRRRICNHHMRSMVCHLEQPSPLHRASINLVMQHLLACHMSEMGSSPEHHAQGVSNLLGSICKKPTRSYHGHHTHCNHAHTITLATTECLFQS